MGKKKSNRSDVQKRNVRHLVPSPRLPLKLLKMTALRPIQGFSAPQISELRKSIRRAGGNTKPGARRKGVGKSQSMVPDPHTFPILANDLKKVTVRKPVCVSRHERREVLFAAKRVGKGSGNRRTRKFTENSSVRC